MSEIAGSITKPNSLQGEYEEVLYRVDSQDRIYFSAADQNEKVTRFPGAEILKAFGHSALEKPSPVQATWHSSEGAKQVTIIGPAGVDIKDQNDRTKDVWLYKAEGVGEAIPADKLEFTKIEDSETVEELRQEILELKKMNQNTLKALAVLTDAFERLSVRLHEKGVIEAPKLDKNNGQPFKEGDEVEVEENGSWIGGFKVQKDANLGEKVSVVGELNGAEVRRDVDWKTVRRSGQPATGKIPEAATTNEDAKMKIKSGDLLKVKSIGGREEDLIADSEPAKDRKGSYYVIAYKEDEPQSRIVYLEDVVGLTPKVDTAQQPPASPTTTRTPQRTDGVMDKIFYGPLARRTNRRIVEEPGATSVDGETTVVDRDPEATVITQEEIEEDRRSRLGLLAGGVAIGAILVGGAVALDALLKRYGGPGIDHHKEVIINNNPGGIKDIQKTVHDNNDILTNPGSPLNRKITKLMGIVRDLRTDEAREALTAKLTNFSPDSFFGRTPHEAVSNAFNVIRDNDIKVRGLTSHKINMIAQYMEQHHTHIASGVDASGNQHIVDTANWVSGHTDNGNASGQQGGVITNGSSVHWWNNLMHVARHYGVTFKAKA
jgi:hypothetical protein